MGKSDKSTPPADNYKEHAQASRPDVLKDFASPSARDCRTARNAPELSVSNRLNASRISCNCSAVISFAFFLPLPLRGDAGANLLAGLSDACVCDVSDDDRGEAQIEAKRLHIEALFTC